MATGSLQAKRYARAAFEIARGQNKVEGWLADLRKVAASARNPQLVAAMDSPQFPLARKLELLEGHFKGLDPLLSNLLRLLTSRGKFNLLPNIQAEYQDIYNEYKGIVTAEVTTAVPLDDKQKRALVTELEELSSKKVNLITCVAPSILGGIIIEIGGKLIDGSTRSRLAALRTELAGAR